MKEWALNLGIEIQTNAPYCSEQNAVETAHGHLANMARCMLQHARLPRLFFGYAVLYASKISNRLPHPKRKSRTPHELLKGYKPDISWMNVFGCDAYAVKEDSLIKKE
jgi:hypothetical protein